MRKLSRHDVSYFVPDRKTPVTGSTVAVYHSIGAFIVDNFGERIVPIDRVLELAEHYFFKGSDEIGVLLALKRVQHVGANKGKILIVKGEYPYYFSQGFLRASEV